MFDLCVICVCVCVCVWCSLTIQHMEAILLVGEGAPIIIGSFSIQESILAPECLERKKEDQIRSDQMMMATAHHDGNNITTYQIISVKDYVPEHDKIEYYLSPQVGHSVFTGLVVIQLQAMVQGQE